MKKIFAVLLLITLTSVAFTSQANAVNHKTEFLVSECSPDIVFVATVDLPKIEVPNVAGLLANYIANKEDVITNFVISNSINNEKIIAKVHLPYEVGLTNIKTSNINSTSHAKIHLPYEVGLTKSNI